MIDPVNITAKPGTEMRTLCRALNFPTTVEPPRLFCERHWEVLHPCIQRRLFHLWLRRAQRPKRWLSEVRAIILTLAVCEGYLSDEDAAAEAMEFERHLDERCEGR